LSANRYLKQRNGRWHYVRRVPGNVSHLDERKLIQISLKTDSIELARKKRDALEEANSLYWAQLNAGKSANVYAEYEALQKRALAMGFGYAPTPVLADEAPIIDILERVEALEGRGGKAGGNEVKAVLGGADRPDPLLSQVLEYYISEIAPIELVGKSGEQKKLWETVKRRPVMNFISVVGDKPVSQITIDDANRFHQWWANRIIGVEGERPRSGNSGNREIGNLRLLLREYNKRIGNDDYRNPFKGLSFKEPNSRKRVTLPFEVGFIVEKILQPQSFKSLNNEAAMVVLAMVETGCRPSEICNLPPEQIHMDAEVPFIEIKYQKDRAIKTESSERIIPLNGISLQAFRHYPQGIPRYRDKENSLSAVLMKHFKVNGLLPTINHRIYSLRHSFEKRMLEAGIDHDLRMTLMGHSNARPAYGDGGSPAFRLEQMKRFEIPVADDLAERIFQA